MDAGGGAGPTVHVISSCAAVTIEHGEPAMSMVFDAANGEKPVPDNKNKVGGSARMSSSIRIYSIRECMNSNVK